MIHWLPTPQTKLRSIPANQGVAPRCLNAASRTPQRALKATGSARPKNARPVNQDCGPSVAGMRPEGLVRHSPAAPWFSLVFVDGGLSRVSASEP
jgi:hypothetical protein